MPADPEKFIGGKLTFAGELMPAILKELDRMTKNHIVLGVILCITAYCFVRFIMSMRHHRRFVNWLKQKPGETNEEHLERLIKRGDHR